MKCFLWSASIFNVIFTQGDAFPRQFVPQVQPTACSPTYFFLVLPFSPYLDLPPTSSPPPFHIVLTPSPALHGSFIPPQATPSCLVPSKF